MADPQTGRPSLTDLFPGAATEPGTGAISGGRPSLDQLFPGAKAMPDVSSGRVMAPEEFSNFVQNAEIPPHGLIGDIMAIMDKAGTLMVGGEANRRAIGETIRGHAPEGSTEAAVRETGARLADAAISMGPAIAVSRLGARTGAAKEAIRSGEFTGEFVKPTGEKVPVREQVAKGYREVIPLAPSFVQKAVGPAVAPLVGAGADILSTVAESKPARWIQDRLSTVFGTEPGSPVLKAAFKGARETEGNIAVEVEKQKREAIMLDDWRKKITATTGLTGKELEDAIGLAWEQGEHPGTPGFDLSQKYPALGAMGKYLRYTEETQRQALKNVTEAPTLGESQMREGAVPELPSSPLEGLGTGDVLYHGTSKETAAKIEKEGLAPGSYLSHDPASAITFGGLKESNPVVLAFRRKDIEPTSITGAARHVTSGRQARPVARLPNNPLIPSPEEALAQLVHASIEATKATPLTKLALSHRDRLVTEEGARFFGVKDRPGSAAYIRNVNLTMEDLTSRGREAWHDLPIPEINRLARDGELPGYEGEEAAGDIFAADPIETKTAGALYQTNVREHGAYLRKLGREWGKPAKDFESAAAAEKAGFVPLELPERSAFKHILDPAARAESVGIKGGQYGPGDRILLPKQLATWLKGTQMWLDPDGFLRRSFGVLRAYDAYQNLWSGATLTPWLFPATWVRNGFQEWGSSISAGMGPRSLRLGMEIIGNRALQDERLRNAFQHEGLDEVLAANSRRYDPFFGSDDAKTVLGDRHDEAHARFRTEQPQVGPTGRGTFIIWQDDPTTGRPSLQEVTRADLEMEAIRQGQLNLGRLREIRFGLHNEDEQARPHSALSYLRSAFGDPKEDLSFARRGKIADRRLNAWVTHYFEEAPRVGQWLEGILKRGLTPAESSRWTNWYHLDMRRPMTKIERAVFRRLMPFYRWSRFNIPASLRIAVTQPWIPALTLKMMQVLSSGTAEKALTPENFLLYMRQHGGFFPMRVTKDDRGHPILHFVTPQGSFSTMDLVDWFDGLDHARESAIRSLNPILQTALGALVGQVKGEGFTNPATGQAMTGDTIYNGVQMPQALAYLINQWRFFQRTDQWLTDDRSRPSLGLAGQAYNIVSPFRDIASDLTQTPGQNAGILKSVMGKAKDNARSEARRLEKKGASGKAISETFELRMKQLEQTLREMQGK